MQISVVKKIFIFCLRLKNDRNLILNNFNLILIKIMQNIVSFAIKLNDFRRTAIVHAKIELKVGNF